MLTMYSVGDCSLTIPATFVLHVVRQGRLIILSSDLSVLYMK